MTILNFQQHINESTLKNGDLYFRKGKVSEVYDENGEWTAMVKGQEEYNVNITLEGKYIAHTYCECRAFNHADHCKHVVALLYAMMEEKCQPVWNNTHPDAYVLSLVNKMSVDDMRLFLYNELQIPIAAKEFLNFAEMTIESEAVIKHIEVINASFKNLDNIGDKANDPGYRAVKPAHGLLSKAKQAYKAGEITLALDMLFAIISKGPAFDNETYGEENGYYYTIIDPAFVLVDEICTQAELDEYNRRRVTRRAWEGLISLQYDMELYDLHWLDILVRHGWFTEEEKQKLLERLDIIIEHAEENKMSSNVHRLITAKEDIINGTGKVEKKLVSSSQPLPATTKKVTPKAVANKPEVISEKKAVYLKTKTALLEALDQHKTDAQSPTYKALQKELVRLMQQSSDVLELRETSRNFYEQTGDTFFYEAMKDTYVASDWNELLKEQQKGKRGGTAIIRKMNE